MGKRHKKTHVSSVRHGESPTIERTRHLGGTRIEIIDRDLSGHTLIRRHKAAWECPLDAYFERGVLSQSEHQAGHKFRRAYIRAVMRVRTDDSSGGAHGDRQMAAVMPIYSEQLLKAAYATLSTQQRAIIINVCGHDEVAGHSARLKTLHRGLERLCALWDL
jgi:hypothetical protein